ncbi:MAG: hypothetical protein HY741_24160 [Chloroflexi bacterium]|nr:hypothetical protein [Chloroflexota bacterium]
MLRKISWLFTLAAIAAAALFVLGPQNAAAQSGDNGKRWVHIAGPITALDTTAQTVTINDPRKGSVTVNATPTTKIRVDENKNATLADLAVGDFAKALYDPATMNAAQIFVKRPRVAGPITALDATAMTVTLDDHKQGLVTLNVTPTTQIRVDENKNAAFADLAVGQLARATYDPSTMNALEIFAVNPGVNGVITAVDTTAQTVTINDHRTGPVTLNVTATTRLRVDDNENATLADLAVGQFARAAYNPGTLDALRIWAFNPKIAGSISALDETAQTVTIQPRFGAAVTLNVTANTKIMKHHVPIAFSDLKVGDKVFASYNPQTMEALRIEVKGK